MIRVSYHQYRATSKLISLGCPCLSFGLAPWISHENCLLNTPLWFGISNIKVNVFATNYSQPKPNSPLDLPTSAPSASCVSKLKILQSSLTLLYSFSPLSRQAAYCIRSSFIAALGSPYSHPFQLLLQNSRLSWLCCLQLFPTFDPSFEELQERGQVTEDGSFRH